jgi:dienelactone hydrolase
MDRRYRAGLPLFRYNRQAPLEVSEVAPPRSEDGIIIHDLSYASPKGGRVPAFLVEPKHRGVFAGLLILHGLDGDRNEFLDLATMYAKVGTVVILIDAPLARPKALARPERFTFTERDRFEQIQLILDLRRAVDLLTERTDVDPAKIGYIGVSYGAAMGGLLAGVEHRIGAYALALGDGGPVEHFAASEQFRQLPADRRERWLKAMEPIEPLYYVRHAAPSALLFQSARQDELVPADAARRFQQAGSKPKEIIWYESTHTLSSDMACDQATWLNSLMGLRVEKDLLPFC